MPQRWLVRSDQTRMEPIWACRKHGLSTLSASHNGQYERVRFHDQRTIWTCRFGDGGFGPGQAVPLDPATGAITTGQSVQDIPGAEVLSAVACPAAALCFGTGANDSSQGAEVDVGVPASSVAAPAVTAVSPATGPASGGTTVTINGSGFTGATKVSFGPDAGTSVTVVSSTQITVASPAIPPERST